MSEVQGVYAAAITPRGRDGDIDLGAAFELIDFLCKGGVNGIALFTASGEFPAWTDEERSRLVYLAVKRSRVPVLVGVGSVTLERSVGLARGARDAGAAGLLAPPPHFYLYDQDDIREFYLQFASQVGGGAPIFLAQLPESGANLQASTAAELLATGRFAGLEMNADGIPRMNSSARYGGTRILSIDDASFQNARAAGAHAAISPVAGVLPELMAGLDRAILNRNDTAAAALENRLQEFLGWIQQFPRPAILKFAAAQRGIKSGSFAIPLPLEKQKKLEQFRLWFSEWLPSAKKLAANG